MTAIQAEAERKRQAKSVRSAEKHRRRAGMLQLYGPVRLTSGVARPKTPVGVVNACSTGAVRRS